MCVRPGVRSARTTQTHTAGLQGGGSGDIMACRQMAATSHHTVNNPISHWAHGTRCRARCVSEVHVCAVWGGRIPAVSFREPEVIRLVKQKQAAVIGTGVPCMFCFFVMDRSLFFTFTSLSDPPHPTSTITPTC